jgi:hypothetical protein
MEILIFINLVEKTRHNKVEFNPVLTGSTLVLYFSSNTFDIRSAISTLFIIIAAVANPDHFAILLHQFFWLSFHQHICTSRDVESGYGSDYGTGIIRIILRTYSFHLYSSSTF